MTRILSCALLVLLSAPMAAQSPTFLPGTTVPDAPRSLTVTVAASTVAIAWNPPSSGPPPDSYEVLAALTPGGSPIASLRVNGTAISVPNVPGGTYYLTVRGLNIAGPGDLSNEVAASVGGSVGQGCQTAPNPAQGLVATVVGNSVSFSWSAATTGCPATGFVLRAGSGPGLTNIAQVNLGAQRSLTTSAPNGTYYVRVVAGNAFGSSAASNEVTVVVGGGNVPNANVAGVWDATATPGPYRPYSRYTVSISQSGTTLSGTILPVGATRTTRLLGSVSGNTIRFGSETAYWNDVINGRPDIGVDFYWTMTLDATGRMMSGTCSGGCTGSATKR